MEGPHPRHKGECAVIRVAVAGAGYMGTVHATRWAALPGVRVVAVFSRSQQHAETLARQVQAQPYTNLDEFLTVPSDVVDVCLPTNRHPAIALRALESDRHVVCEKPIALTVEEAEQMVRLATARRRLLLVAHVLRFWPEYVELRRLVRSGAIGAPTSCLAQRLQEGPGSTPDAAETRAINGGPVIDLQIHDDDFLHWMFGAPHRVLTRGSERHFFTTLDFGQTVAVAEAACDLPKGHPFLSAVRVRGEEGLIEYTFTSGGARPDNAPSEGAGLTLWLPDQGPRTVSIPPVDPYTEQIKHFSECLRTEQPSALVSPGSAVDALRVALAARRSLDSSQPVSLVE